MRVLKKLTTTFPLILMAFSIAMPVQASQWDLLGERSVKRSVEKDVMPVTVAEGGFKQIKVLVNKSPVNIKKIIVEYANGKRDELKVRAVIGAGDESRPLDLRGGKRVIRKITFYYETIEKGRGKSIVKVLGRR